MALIALIFAAAAIVYTEVLTDPDMILGGWAKFLHKYIKSDWLLKPLIDCVYCFGGQLALWGYLFVGNYDWKEHFATVVLTLFYIHIWQRI